MTFKMPKEVVLIAAVDEENGIGCDARIPWNIPEDMRHFKETTMGHTVIMGRATHDSIGRTLPGRRNLVLTRDSEYKCAAGSTLMPGLRAALTMAAESNEERVFVIGGAELYKLSLPYSDTVLLTSIRKSFGCNKFFPILDEFEWTRHTLSSSFTRYEGCTIDFLMLKRNE